MHWRKHDQTPDHHCFHFFNYCGLQNFWSPSLPFPQDWKTIGNSLAKPCQDSREWVTYAYLLILSGFWKDELSLTWSPPVLGGYQKWKLITRGSQRYVTLALRIFLKKRTSSDLWSRFSKIWQLILIYNHNSQKCDNQFWHIITVLKESENWSNVLLQNFLSIIFLTNYFVKTIGSLNFSEKNWNWRFLDYGNLEEKKSRTNCSLVL
jgi:hypothetical protein